MPFDGPSLPPPVPVANPAIAEAASAQAAAGAAAYGAASTILTNRKNKGAAANPNAAGAPSGAGTVAAPRTALGGGIQW